MIQCHCRALWVKNGILGLPKRATVKIQNWTFFPPQNKTQRTNENNESKVWKQKWETKPEKSSYLLLEASGGWVIPPGSPAAHLYSRITESCFFHSSSALDPVIEPMTNGPSLGFHRKRFSLNFTITNLPFTEKMKNHDLDVYESTKRSVETEVSWWKQKQILVKISAGLMEANHRNQHPWVLL